MNERFILGSKINDISFEEAKKMIASFLATDKTNYIVTPNPEICLKAYKDTRLREIIKNADLAIPDGFGLKIGGLIFNQKINHIFTGVDLSYEIFKMAEKMNLSVLLIGGKGKSGTKALNNLKKTYPKLKVDYLNGGKFNDKGVSEYKDFIDKINQIHPDIILVNLGAPKQEYFIDNYKSELNARLILGVGGTIDFISGHLKRAPKWMRRLGLEWLFRLIQEPWRWQRIIKAVIIFPITCLWWRWRNLTIYRRSVVGFIINKNKQVLIAKRIPRPGDRYLNDHWQLPQGGVDKGEKPNQAILREMKEELGLKNLQIIASVKNAYKYKWGPQAKSYMPYKGQKQTLYLLYYPGNNNDVVIDKHEFSDYQWISHHHVLQKVHDYRKPITQIALKKFNQYL